MFLFSKFINKLLEDDEFEEEFETEEDDYTERYQHTDHEEDDEVDVDDDIDDDPTNEIDVHRVTRSRRHKRRPSRGKKGRGD